MCLYPDDCECNPVQLTLHQWVRQGLEYWDRAKENREQALKFLKFALAGWDGVDLDDQWNVTLNVLQGIQDIQDITITCDYDSLIGTTKTLPYRVPLTVWPAPSFRDTLTINNHVTAPAINSQDQVVYVPMHKIPNLAFGKVANCSIIHVFFPYLRPYFNDAYFRHELCGWKAATVHNLDIAADDTDGANAAYEQVNALDDLTCVLHMPSINPRQWLIDVGLEFGNPEKAVTW
ncbi:hypothetical protein F5J12DRAFT_787609 [Pisolithus orientalis]|uniref:uncharacterized protein n=1 Tax=Pisolithus orientalis TaxID=936130 RepID=UPI0022248377|nr:uncharacterized protein F5J12DRAFT_787609 [Pisolithus orientalis]KAI5984195.1 hypothetical protein F5J12DRAFT_787609 [Pisolithus orientalis]